jgi:hypothetical protein
MVNFKVLLLQILDAIEPRLPLRARLAIGMIRWAIDKYLSGEDAFIDLPDPSIPPDVSAKEFVELIFTRLADQIPSEFIKSLIYTVKDFAANYLLNEIWAVLVQVPNSAPRALKAMEPKKTAPEFAIGQLEGTIDEAFSEHLTTV